MLLRCFIIVIILTLAPVCCQHYDDTKKLIETVLGTSKYHVDVRPVLNQSEPVYVSVSFEILSIVEVNDIMQSFICNGIVQMSWVDQRATWDPADYGGKRNFHPTPKQIWRPRVVLVNTLDQRDLFEDDYSPTNLDYDGKMWWFPGSLFPTSCKLDLTKYPFDEQHCYISMLPMAMRVDEVEFIAGSVLLTSYTVNGAWDLVDYEMFTGTVGIPDGLISNFEVRFHLKRRPTFFLLNILLPVVLLSFLNIMVFVIPVDSGEKISYGITVLLALTVFISIVSSMLPQSSETIPHVIVYLFSLLVVSLLTVVDTIVIVFLHHMEEREERSMKARRTFKSAISAIETMSRPTSPTGGIGDGSQGTETGTDRNGATGPFATTLNIRDVQVKRNSWIDVITAIEKDNGGKGRLGKDNNNEKKDDDDDNYRRVNKYKMIGKHIDMVSFFVFTLVWLILTLWIFISIAT